MKQVSRCLGILILAGSMAAPAHAAPQHGPASRPHRQAEHVNHGGQGAQRHGGQAMVPHQQLGQMNHGSQGANRCSALEQTGPSASTYASATSIPAAIGQGYLGPGRTDPLPLALDASGKKAPQVCCLIEPTEGETRS